MKKIDSMIKYRIPDNGIIAPEQARIFLGKTDITPKNYDTARSIGYALYTDINKAEILIKRFIRQKTNISKKIEKKFLAIKTSDGGNIHLQHSKVNRFDIHEKLSDYKLLKKAYNESCGHIETTSCQLDGKYKPIDVKKKSYRPELLKKITFI